MRFKKDQKNKPMKVSKKIQDLFTQYHLRMSSLGDLTEEAGKLKRLAWDQVYKELNLDSSRTYTYSEVTKSVIRLDE